MRDRFRYYLEGTVLEPKRSPVFKMVNLLDNKFEKHPKTIIGACVALILFVGFGDEAYDFLTKQSEKSDVGITIVIPPVTRPTDAPASD